MRFPVRPELTTASVVHGLNTDHARRCWTTLHRSQPTRSHLSIGVCLFRSTEPLLIGCPSSGLKQNCGHVYEQEHRDENTPRTSAVRVRQFHHVSIHRDNSILQN